MQAMIGEQFNTLMTPAAYNTNGSGTIRTLLKPIHKVVGVTMLVILIMKFAYQPL